METHKNVLGVVREMHQFPQINLVAKKKMKRVDTREAWLHEASYLCVAAIKKTAADLNIELTEPKNGYDVSMAPITSRRCIGLCYGASDCRDEKARIVIDVSLECPVRVIHVLLHELVHAYTNGDGHRGRFPKIMKALGSEGKMTATVEGELQAEWISERVLTLLPEWSSVHSVWSFKRRGQRGKGSRLVKLQCMCCGCIFRMSNKWIEEAHALSCPCCYHQEVVVG
jgi:hypothetical protein